MHYPAGWTCERTTLRFEHYVFGTLLPAEALARAEHLECAQDLLLYRLTITTSSTRG
jgi:hypothetical protein